MEMRFLDAQQLDDLNVNWYPKEFVPWYIEPNGAGVAAVTHSKDRTRTAKFVYYADGIPRLIVEDTQSNIEDDWLSDALKQITSVVAFDGRFPSEVLRASLHKGMLILELTLRDIDGAKIKISKWPGGTVDGPRYMWGPFSFTVPTENAEITIGIAARNPV
jgi:hypothetical protein